MSTLVLTWLALCLALCAYAWYGYRNTLALPVVALLAALVVYVPTGTPRFTAPPPGKYAVLGAKIEIGRSILVLLDSGSGEPIYYRLPYSDRQANGLQGALDAAGEGGGVSVEFGEGGGVRYDGDPPVSGDDNKQSERPALEMG